MLFLFTENPPSANKQVSKMLVIKKVSKEDPSAAFSAGFASAGPLPTNGTKVSIAGPSVYKNLVPKPATAPSKVGQARPTLACLPHRAARRPPSAWGWQCHLRHLFGLVCCMQPNVKTKLHCFITHLVPCQTWYPQSTSFSRYVLAH